MASTGSAVTTASSSSSSSTTTTAAAAAGSYSINIDYTNLGRVEVKIQVMADDHEKALVAAQNLISQQKNWFKKHKEETRAEHQHYKKLLHYGPDYDDQAKIIEIKQNETINPDPAQPDMNTSPAVYKNNNSLNKGIF